MAEPQTRFERLELKYLIDESTVERIRAEIEAHCAADPYSTGSAPDRPGGAGYTIHSLYLDSPALAFYQAKLRGDPERIKLRVRTYSDTSPATLEIKRRHSSVIRKTRAVVDRRFVEAAANGFLPPTPVADSQLPFLRDFAYTFAGSGAGPTLNVAYEREAYVSLVDAYARITFDRHIRVRRTSDWELCPGHDDWYSFDDHWRTDHPTLPVVLEIKCETSRVPCWVIDLIRRNELCETSFSKYSIGIALTQWRCGGEVAPAHSLARALEGMA
jgi:SPX domain protein involved in polyphosphate accumulation